ncbi:MAG: hypothetical protein DDT29_01193 [Dehalococcoidia bacterium]|nr:hypothetical protein [Bacillota bacterium]
MSKKSTKWRAGWSLVVVLALLLSLPGGLVLPEKVAASEEAASVFLDPPSQTVEVDETTTVQIRIKNVSNLYGAEVHLAFDRTLLKVVDADPIMDGVQITPSTDFFAFTPGQYFIHSAEIGGYFIARAEADNAAGTISYVFTLLAPASPVSVGPDGKVLATITFKCKAPGEANIIFKNPVEGEPPVKLADAAGLPITILPENIRGAVIVQEVEDVVPEVVSTFPTAGATDVAIDTNITATFSKDMDVASINTTTFTIVTDTTPITGTVSYDAATKMASFDPDTDLAFNTTYTATITTGAKDTAGNPLAADHSWVFTTGAPPPPRYTLTVTVDPAASGTVSLSPPQPAEGYLAGTVVTLTAAPAAGFRFDRWSGDATGTEPTTTVTMTRDKSVTAHFDDVVTLTTVEVNSGDKITVAPDGTVGNIPLAIKRIPAGAGVGAFTFALSWDPGVIRIDKVDGEAIARFFITAGIPDNTKGTVTIAGFMSPTALIGADVTVARLSITAVGKPGDSTLINVSITALGDPEGKPISATPVNAPVQIQAGVAETSIFQAEDADRVVIIPVIVNRIKDLATGTPVDIPGGLGVIQAKVSSFPEGGIEILNVRGTDYFPSPTFNPVTGVFAAFVAPSPTQPNNTMVAKVVPRLIGSATKSYRLTIAFQVIGAAAEELNVPEEHPNSLTFLRGDATGDGSVNIFDAMFIAQKVVGLRGLDTVNAVNAASVKHDGAKGDKINIFDAMFIAQYVVRLRDANFNWVVKD